MAYSDSAVGDRSDGDGSAVRLLRVAPERAGQRLDNFLFGPLKGAPKSLVYKLIRSGQVRVNGGRVRPERRLQAGDQVRIPPLPAAVPERGRGTPSKWLLSTLAASVVFEDERLLAIDKPPGVASHGGSGIGFGVIEALRALRPGDFLELVHRLDRDTSGLLLLAKKRATLAQLQALMRNENGSGVEKHYLTLLTGRMPAGVMEVDAPLHVHLRQGGERHVQVGAGGKPASSRFRSLQRHGGHSYCEVSIATGRTHQIRVHARHIGHPVAGDAKYGDLDVNRRLRDKIGLQRLFLHAASLRFALDQGRTAYFLNAPLASDLARALERLGG